MKSLFYLAAVLLATTASPFPNGETLPKLVIGGVPAAPGQFPFYVRITIPKKFYVGACGASLLSDRYLLTAAHCVTNSLFTPSFTAFAGMTDLNDRFTSKVQRSQIVEVIYPKDNLTGKTDLGDIAILKMENPITFSSTVQPTKIVRNDSSLTVASKEGVLIGFGKTTWKEDVPSTTHDLLYAEVPFVDEKLCKRVYGKRATEREFCAGGKGKGQAPGDSGGPFGVIKNGEWIQVGLPSQGFSTNNKKLNPSILTRVASYCDFIEETTKGAFLCF